MAQLWSKNNGLLSILIHQKLYSITYFPLTKKFGMKYGFNGLKLQVKENV